jgi:hypothetical protein
VTVDTLAYVKDLEANGVDRRQAEAHATAMSKHIMPELATKADIDRVRTDLETSIDRVRTDLESSIERNWLRVAALVPGTVLAGVAITVTLVKLL